MSTVSTSTYFRLGFEESSVTRQSHHVANVWELVGHVMDTIPFSGRASLELRHLLGT